MTATASAGHPPAVRTAQTRLVVVTTGPFDRRTAAALHVAATIPAAVRIGLHVATDPELTHAVGVAWMDAAVEMPLLIADDAKGIDQGVADFVRAALDAVADHVTIVAGRLVQTGRWHRFLHDATAAGIARAVADDDRVTPVLVAVPTSPVVRSPS